MKIMNHDGASSLSTLNLIPTYGSGWNYKLSVTVSSNDLILAIKTIAGNDPSATDPVIFNIGGTERILTSALSVTAADGTNWADLGSTAHATLERDLAAYIGYNATDGITLGWSRIFHALQYGDFSTTSTNEKYAKISTITTAASTDPYHVIGRFAATLSAGAGYTWTVPTFTPSNLIHRPIDESRFMTWEPSIGVAAGTTPVYSTFVNRFKIRGDTVFIQCKWSGDGGNEGNGAAAIIGTLPFAISTTIGSQNRWAFGYGLNLNNATAHYSTFQVDASNNTFIIMNEGTAALTGTLQNNATRYMTCQGEYDI